MLRSLMAFTVLALSAAPAAAATYSAKPASPVSESRIVARDILWACGDGACVGSSPNGRPLVVCQALAKKTGQIESFLVDGRPIASAELERCNASAKAIPANALAAH